MTSKRQIIRRQRRWARSAGLEPDAGGYLPSIDSNLFRPLSPAAAASFSAGGGPELAEAPGRPAKLRALHSSAALAVNFFDGWTPASVMSLLAALDLDAPETGFSGHTPGEPGTARGSVRFEAKFPTGLTDSTPRLDVAIELTDGRTIGIESKFTEWLTPKRTTGPAFKDKYFKHGSTPWSEAGLPECQQLAADLMSGCETFRYLDAAQLLKHALGLAVCCAKPPSASAVGSRGTRLLYLYFEIDCPAGSRHRDEIARFTARVDASLGFRAMTYQTLFGRLAARNDVDPRLLAYLSARYIE